MPLIESAILDSASGILGINAQFGEDIPMEVLSEVLKVVRLEGALYFNGEFSAPPAMWHRARASYHVPLSDRAARLREAAHFCAAAQMGDKE